MTRRDLLVALIASALTLGAVAATSAQKTAALGSQVFDWKGMTPKPNATGEVRTVVRAPTVTLEELEMHITTLKPGEASHPPHQHPNEELLIIREGTVEALVAGEHKRIGPGSIIFQASNQLHNIRNVGDTPATYHVINWKTAATPHNP
jgi:quercetin dioxygenase-like cupin family protein